MKLEVRERLSLYQLLEEISQKGEYSALKTLIRAKQMVAFTAEEREFYKIVQEGAKWNWDAEAAAKNIKDVPVDEFTTNKVRETLAEMNQAGELTNQYVSLYEKFVIAYK